MSVEEDTELRDLVANTLEMNGVLSKIRAELRANVFLALEEQDALQKKNVSNKALKNFLDTKEGHQAFSIVREFLQFFNLDFTLAVLDPESDYSGKASSREKLINEMNLQSVDAKAPIFMEMLKNKGEGRVSPPSPKLGSKIPQRVSDPKLHKTSDIHKTKDNNFVEKNLSSYPDDLDLENEDDLLKELGVSPISYNTTMSKKSTKPSWLSSEPLHKSTENFSRTHDENGLSRLANLGSLKNAPPLSTVGKTLQMNEPGLDVTSPEWDDLMKIDQKISELGFEIPKEDSNSGYKDKKPSSKNSGYNYEDDFNDDASSQKSDGLSITEEIEDDISIGSFAGSKADDHVTTDQTVSQISTGFDYGEDAEIY